MANFSIGDTLAGGYLILDIKAGGMGVVYICHQPSTGRYYAIKTVRSELSAESDEFLRRFKDEVFNWIRISSEAHHPSIVDALLFHEDEQWLFLQYVDGPHLHDLTRIRPPHPLHAVRWARDIAEGVRVLHERFQLVHRDLKPRNVLVDQVGLVAKITDLGIGRVLQEEGIAETMIGTPGYMAPETLRGETDFRADIYSFGALLYRMLTGSEPYGRGLPSESSTLVPPSARTPHAPRGTDRLVARCLSESPDDRYQEFGPIIEELRAVEEQLGDPQLPDYEFCERHEYWAPQGEGLPQCIFCGHQREREVLLEKAMAARDARQSATQGATRVYDDAGARVQTPTMTTPPASVPGPATITDRPPAGPIEAPATGGARTGSWVGLLLVVVLIGGAVAWGLLADRDDRAPGNGPPPVAGNGDHANGDQNGGDENGDHDGEHGSDAQKPDWGTYSAWDDDAETIDHDTQKDQKIAPEDSLWSCPDCSRRFAEPHLQQCKNCGAMLKRFEHKP